MFVPSLLITTDIAPAEIRTTAMGAFQRRGGRSASSWARSLAAFMLPFALLSYPFGRLSERFSRVAMIAVGTPTYGLATTAVGFCPREALAPLMLIKSPICAESKPWIRDRKSENVVV
jgi:MFS family permease